MADWQNFPGGKLYTSNTAGGPSLIILHFDISPVGTSPDYPVGLELIGIKVPGGGFYSYSQTVRGNGSIISYGSASQELFQAIRLGLTSVIGVV